MRQQHPQRFQGGRGSKERGNSQKSEGEKKTKKMNFYST
jgi:hypothetical protein